MRVTIGVTDLATFVHRRGDIDDRAEDPTSAREGIESQRAYQKKLKQARSNYSTEVQVTCELTQGAITLQVSGRVDGVSIEDELHGTRLVVEEIKTTRKDVPTIPTCDRTVHAAQVRLYAAMLDQRHKVSVITTRLTYIHPDTGRVLYVDQEEELSALDDYLNKTLLSYCGWLNGVVLRLKRRNESASNQPFPFPSYNENQLPLARSGYVSLRDETNLLMEAPTGSGKTMAAAYPAVKAMGESELDRVVYSTARTTGQRAAADAFAQLRVQNDAFVQVTVSAKERVCLTPGAACRPEECEYAKGHYDRVRSSVTNLLRKGNIDRGAIDAVAKSNKVCPFELSLDVAEWADAVVCDYNYVFDPLVRLSRLRSRLFDRVGLLVDEAHRLTERVREMLSCRFDLDAFAEAIDDVGETPFSFQLQNIRRILENTFDDVLPSPGEVALNEIDSSLSTVVNQLFDSDVIQLHSSDDSTTVQACLSELFRFRAIWPIREESRMNFVWMLKCSEEERSVALRCLLPNTWIRDVVGSFHGSVRFSGTLSPGELFNEEHGLVGPIKRTSLVPNIDRLSVQVVPDISTYYDDRKVTAPNLARLIDQIRESSQGSWMIAFPSFAYMDLVRAHITDASSVLVQKSPMTLEEREGFLHRLTIAGRQLGFVVMGGVFTESIDIEQTSLEGVVVISPGIPPRSLERDRVAAASPHGYEMAYRRPAMTRVVQAAGRVVRGENDRGVVVLVDPRFTRRDFARYFPPHWQPKIVKSPQLVAELQKFRDGQIR